MTLPGPAGTGGRVRRRVPGRLATGCLDQHAAHPPARHGRPAAHARAAARNVLIGGQTAIFADFAGVLSSKLPLFIGVVVLLSFLLLAAVFRSIVIPLMAAVMNMLSAGAAFGVLVAVFQWGWAASLFGIDQTGPIEAFIPVMMFAILFGLSMDYEVFLVSRIYEEWHRTGDNRLAVTRGLAGNRPHDHRGRGDHGARLRLVHPRRTGGDRDVRPRPRRRRAPGRADRPHGRWSRR